MLSIHYRGRLLSFYLPVKYFSGIFTLRPFYFLESDGFSSPCKFFLEFLHCGYFFRFPAVYFLEHAFPYTTTWRQTDRKLIDMHARCLVYSRIIRVPYIFFCYSEDKSVRGSLVTQTGCLSHRHYEIRPRFEFYCETPRFIRIKKKKYMPAYI